MDFVSPSSGVEEKNKMKTNFHPKKTRTEKRKSDFERVAHFIYEAGIHSKTHRSGVWFLGSGTQSVAEHLFRTALIAYSLCYFIPKANKEKVLLMSLSHDLGEGRTSDLNYVHQRYGRLAEAQAVADIAQSIPFGDTFKKLYEEEQERKTIEAKIVRDADQLEWVASLRTEEEKGNKKARRWATLAVKRLATAPGKRLGALLMKTHPDSWWFDEKDAWFINRGEKNRKWRKGK